MSEKDPKATPPRPSKGPHMIKEGENISSRKIVQENTANKNKKKD